TRAPRATAAPTCTPGPRPPTSCSPATAPCSSPSSRASRGPASARSSSPASKKPSPPCRPPRSSTGPRSCWSIPTHSAATAPALRSVPGAAAGAPPPAAGGGGPGGGAPPPPPPQAVLAVRLPRSDTVRLFVAVPEPDLEIIARRGSGVTPQTPEQGEPVYDGP